MYVSSPSCSSEWCPNCPPLCRWTFSSCPEAFLTENRGNWYGISQYPPHPCHQPHGSPWSDPIWNATLFLVKHHLKWITASHSVSLAPHCPTFEPAVPLSACSACPAWLAVGAATATAGRQSEISGILHRRHFVVLWFGEISHKTLLPIALVWERNEVLPNLKEIYQSLFTLGPV